jgi:hypothetical protein
MGQLLEHQGGIEAGEAGAAMGFVHIEAGEAEGGGLAQFLRGEMALGVPFAGVGGQATGCEGARGFLEGALVFGEVEIHQCLRLLGLMRRSPAGWLQPAWLPAP